MPKKIDLTGKRFGRLVVVKETDKRKGDRIIWECKCDCGNIKNIIGYNLTRNMTKSCGCLQKERVSKAVKEKKSFEREKLIGEKFGRLTIISTSVKTDKFGNHFLFCKCSCGNIVETRLTGLMSGRTRSCGCLRLDLLKQRGIESISNAYEFNKDNNFKEDTLLCALGRKKSKNNQSGVKGVHWCTSKNKWIARITFKKEVIFLGSFSNLVDATKARKEAEEKYFTPILEKYGRLEEKP